MENRMHNTGMKMSSLFASLQGEPGAGAGSTPEKAARQVSMSVESYPNPGFNPGPDPALTDSIMMINKCLDSIASRLERDRISSRLERERIASRLERDRFAARQERERIASRMECPQETPLSERISTLQSEMLRRLEKCQKALQELSNQSAQLEESLGSNAKANKRLKTIAAAAVRECLEHSRRPS